MWKNTTGLTLEGGPVTVLEGESYVGEAMIETLKPDEERIVPYSVDLGCVVSLDHHSEERAVHRVFAVDGVLRLCRYRIEQRIYLVTNKTDREIDLFLDHRFRRGWDLVDTPEPHETTEDCYRFRFDVPPAKTVRFVVNERHEEAEVCTLREIDADTVAFWVSSRYIDDATRDELQKIVALSAELTDTGRTVVETEREITEATENQDRLRKNLRALGTSPDEHKLRERYVRELGSEEDRLQSLNDRLRAARSRRAELEREIERCVRAVDVDRRL